MNRPKRPIPYNNRRRKPGPPTPTTSNAPQQPRRRSPLEMVPQNPDQPFKVLKPGFDRQTSLVGANPVELAVIQGFTREIEEAFQKHHGRPDEFWGRNGHLLETARKLDDILAGIQTRRSG
ncbi:MAG: hypothetical protein FJX77_05480 [Armatimonadetes bacterium]|nr:hypothetical protein [Armatimonadota bacterium]